MCKVKLVRPISVLFETKETIIGIVNKQKILLFCRGWTDKFCVVPGGSPVARNFIAGESSKMFIFVNEYVRLWREPEEPSGDQFLYGSTILN